MREALRRGPLVVDGVVAAVLGVLTLGELTAWTAVDLAPAPAALLALAVSAPVAVRRRAPVAACLAWAALGLGGAPAIDGFDEPIAPYLGGILLAYAAGAHAGGRRALAAVLAVLATMAVIGLLHFEPREDVLFPLAFIAVTGLTGRAVRQRARLAAELHEAAAQAAEAHAAARERAAAEERRRIARELHDVVAHSMSVMVIQSGGARRILAQDPARAEQAAARIEATGREALGEMRRLLGFLRAPGEATGHAPAPSLGDLGALADRARAAGLPVALRVEGEARPLPGGLELAAYRIVQESLTNALKHAGAAPTEVDLRWGDGALELEVVDAGPATPGVDGDAGHGLIGMRERVQLYGGELDAGRRPGGGFAVRARLPIEGGTT